MSSNTKLYWMYRVTPIDTTIDNEYRSMAILIDDYNDVAIMHYYDKNVDFLFESRMSLEECRELCLGAILSEEWVWVKSLWIT